MTFVYTFCSCRPSENSISFEKIIYHTSHCFGSCPTYHLEFDNKKNLKLFAEKVYKKGLPLVSEEDTEKMGYFTGRVDDTTFAKLNNIVNKIGIDTLAFDNAACCDGSLKTIIVYNQGKRKYLKSMFPPERAYKLIETLDQICRTNGLKRTIDKFTIED